MTRQDNKLTALKVKALEKPGRYGDGLGLWLQVSENRGKSWVFRYMLHGTALDDIRVSPQREFFKAPFEEIRERIDRTISYYSPECQA
jgi:hypothetical protein